nr:transposase [Algibacillus agarilyticus]
MDSYIADTEFRSRNPLFQKSETYQTEKEKRRSKRRGGKPKLFTAAAFHFDNDNGSCHCPAGKKLWRQSKHIQTGDKIYVRFTGYLKDCRACPLQAQCMRKPPQKTGRQVQFELNADTQLNHTARMKIKIDSAVGRREYSKRLGTIG